MCRKIQQHSRVSKANETFGAPAEAAVTLAAAGEVGMRRAAIGRGGEDFPAIGRLCLVERERQPLLSVVPTWHSKSLI